MWPSQSPLLMACYLTSMFQLLYCVNDTLAHVTLCFKYILHSRPAERYICCNVANQHSPLLVGTLQETTFVKAGEACTVTYRLGEDCTESKYEREKELTQCHSWCVQKHYRRTWFLWRTVAAVTVLTPSGFPPARGCSVDELYHGDFTEDHRDRPQRDAFKYDNSSTGKKTLECVFLSSSGKTWGDLAALNP